MNIVSQSQCSQLPCNRNVTGLGLGVATLGIRSIQRNRISPCTGVPVDRVLDRRIGSVTVTECPFPGGGCVRGSVGERNR